MHDAVLSAQRHFYRLAGGASEAAALLAERGHVLDSQPEAMARTLASPPSRPPLEGRTSAGWMEDVGTLNDAAYGYDGSLRRALGGLAGDGLHVYVSPSAPTLGALQMWERRPPT
jgi:hypothetical protein